MTKNEIIINELKAAKIQIMSFNHAFSYLNNVYYKLIESDKTDLNISINNDKQYFKGGKNKSIKVNGVLLNLTFEFGSYTLPANTYFIDQTIKGLTGVKIAKFEKYHEYEITSDFKKIGVISKDEINLLKTASKFADADSLRPAFECVCIENKTVYATNTFSLYKQPIDNPLNILINLTGQKFINSCKNTIFVSESENGYQFESEGKSVIYHKITDKLPIESMNKILLQFANNDLTASVNRKNLIEVIKQVAIYANQASNLIQFEFNKGLTVSGADTDFLVDSKKHLRADNVNFSGCIGFKSTQILNVLNSLKTEFVDLKILDSTSAVLLNDILLMPIILKDSEPLKKHVIAEPKELIKPIEVKPKIKLLKAIDINPNKPNFVKEKTTKEKSLNFIFRYTQKETRKNWVKY
jgi:DNA polymerase III sliding clamp (beta) subunit (PCNA family)